MPWSGAIYGGGYDPNTKPVPWGPSNWSYAPDAAAEKGRYWPEGSGVRKLSMDAAGNITNANAPLNQPNPFGTATSQTPTAATLPFPHPGFGVAGQSATNQQGQIGNTTQGLYAALMQWLKKLGGIQNSGNEIPYRGW